HADELEVLRAALDNVQQGVILLDPHLNAQFMNHTVRELLGLTEEQAERKPSYAEICRGARANGIYGAPERELDDFMHDRIARVREGDPTPVSMRLSDGRTVRSQCAVLPDNGRMLIYTNVTDFVRNAEELERLATTDSLTLCYNRRQFWALAEAEWSRFQRYQRPMSMMMFDVDHFKWINDRYGHEAGDHVLARIGEVCRTVKRSSDAIGRLGGDEFAMLLPETDIAQAMIVAQRLRDAMQASEITAGGDPIVAQLSIGIAQATPSHSGAMALLKAADDALYAAKKAGRNQIAVAAAPEAPLGAAAE
ncbi:MAG: diguanylate cyclase, partial [Alphaproteobacteria bacterium]|nr:diguanylate cyclase [Alphaproteobacteria bacterium]